LIEKKVAGKRTEDQDPGMNLRLSGSSVLFPAFKSAINHLRKEEKKMTTKTEEKDTKGKSYEGQTVALHGKVKSAGKTKDEQKGKIVIQAESRKYTIYCPDAEIAEKLKGATYLWVCGNLVEDKDEETGKVYKKIFVNRYRYHCIKKVSHGENLIG